MVCAGVRGSSPSDPPKQKEDSITQAYISAIKESIQEQNQLMTKMSENQHQLIKNIAENQTQLVQSILEKINDQQKRNSDQTFQMLQTINKKLDRCTPEPNRPFQNRQWIPRSQTSSDSANTSTASQPTNPGPTGLPAAAQPGSSFHEQSPSRNTNYPNNSQGYRKYIPDYRFPPRRPCYKCQEMHWSQLCPYNHTQEQTPTNSSENAIRSD